VSHDSLPDSHRRFSRVAAIAKAKQFINQFVQPEQAQSSTESLVIVGQRREVETLPVSAKMS
jgi:hypothetical protein